MADNIPVDTLNAQLIARGLNPENPANTYVDLAQKISQNQQQQAEQEQLIAQAKLKTQQAQEAAAKGYNPNLINTMTKDAAKAYLNVIKESKGLDISDDAINEWYNSLPPLVDRQEVEAFASRFTTSKERTGKEFIATEDDAANKEDENGDPLVVGQSYTTMYDNKGNVSYVRGGLGTALIDAKAANAPKKASASEQAQWRQLVAKVNPYLASSRTQVGVALASYARCVRALEALSKSPVTKQDAANIIAEIGAVYKGGSPDQAQMLETAYNTIYGDFQNWSQSILGRVRNNLPDDIKNHLVTRIEDLENQSTKLIRDAIDSSEALNGDVIEEHQDQWNKFKDVITKALKDPRNAAATTGIDSTNPPPSQHGGAVSEAPAAPQTGTPNPSPVQKSPGGYSYSVNPG